MVGFGGGHLVQAAPGQIQLGHRGVILRMGTNISIIIIIILRQWIRIMNIKTTDDIPVDACPSGWGSLWP